MKKLLIILVLCSSCAHYATPIKVRYGVTQKEHTKLRITTFVLVGIAIIVSQTIEAKK